jgi:DNA-directed RNA polymerase specialized sigma24 family protein
MMQAVGRAISRLDEPERVAVQMRCWEEESLDRIAPVLGVSNRFKARRVLTQVQAKLRRLLLAEMQDTVVTYEDDVGLLAVA